MKVDVYNQKGEVIDKIELSEDIFNVKWNPVLVHQVLVAMQNNQRKPIAHTKNRGEVSGGGRKPWRQKGTGRARHGSIRSPIWIGGGVTFGPRNEKKYQKKINKKAKQLALFSALSKKLTDGEIKVIKEIKINEPKTKEMAKILSQFLNNQKKNQGLLVLPQSDKNIIRATRNLSFAQVDVVDNLNLIDILKYKNIFFLSEAINKLNKKSEDKVK
ncbi:MAG TPA: 50S ribosomal protein L4 [Candidatus Paceibacterota bacterium]|jgi:large subunit ribosomal protein L4|nr:50S ribosomal protein L4 [Parcubacteria group bacterium]HOM33111.1 50S ribosomal protein L4 [Candidatus Paceibacterota bacterium]HPC37356.1 50S ribosomal protein L4 [Candidatus Paceibacterota bacterium]HRU35830.1 50S ribosomal protein L4 [Candidatus Paceibacterota bacterium]